MTSNETPPDLSSLVAKAQQGDLSAQDSLIRTYQRRIAAFVYAMTGRSEAVEDVAQVIFLRMVLGLSRLRQIDRFESWLFRLARNATIEHFRRERWRRFFVPATEDHNEVAAPVTHPSARLENLKAALQKLPAAQRELLVLLQEQEWSYEELATMTGSSVSSVKSRLFRARSELKRLLPDEY
jgi:RNA polymerase sigma-70 factor (ECF subfamily)